MTASPQVMVGRLDFPAMERAAGIATAPRVKAAPPVAKQAAQSTPPEIMVAARRGWRIHPLRPKDKLPYLKEWQYHATSDLAKIEAWAAQFPACNWGAVAGPESKFFAVDVDVPTAMQELEDEHGPIPEGLSNVTSRGYQLLYTWPTDAEVRPATNCPCEGIDVRGRDSYIVIPPSVHPSGHVYYYADDSLPIPACPAWLLALILTRPQATAQSRQSPPAADAVEGERLIPKGRGDSAKLSLAGSMFRTHQPLDVILAAVITLDKRCEHQRGEDECRRKVNEWAKRYARGESLTDKESAILKPELIRLADVEARTVDWLWKPFIPAGMLSMISGDPGAGKSFIALAVSAELSRGKLRDGRIVEPASSLYLSIENPIAETIRPRFDLLGGDPSRFFVLKGTLFAEDGEEQRGAVTLADIPILDAAIVATKARLIVVDPIQSYLGAGVDLHRSNETRPVLDGLSRLAESHGCAIVLLRHLSKQSGGKAIHRGLGSIDLSGAVRSELLAGSLPDDPDARALVHIKSNVGRIGRTLGFSIDGEGRFSWTGESQITASDLLAAPDTPELQGAKQEAEEWLKDALSAGSKDAKELTESAKVVGISYRTLVRAKAALHVESRKATFGGGWLWWLPATKPESGAVQ